MDGHGGHSLNRSTYDAVDPVRRRAPPDGFPPLHYHYGGGGGGGGYPGGELAFHAYESDLHDLHESIARVDDSSTPTHHGGPLSTDYYTASPDYAAAFGLSTLQYCGSMGAGGLVQSPLSMPMPMPTDFANSLIAYHEHHNHNHSRHSSYSFSSAETLGTPGTGSSGDNASPSGDSYHEPMVPCNSLSSTPASTPAPSSYFSSVDPYPEIPPSYGPAEAAEEPCSPTGSFVTETRPPPQRKRQGSASATSILTTSEASTPRLRKPTHRKCKSLQNSSPTEARLPTNTDNNARNTNATAGLASGQLRARMKHKRVEKQYRDRLSAQFERLLSVLPADRFYSNNSEDGDAAYDGEGGEGGGFNGSDPSARIVDAKSVTRAEVLTVAVKYIEESQLQ